MSKEKKTLIARELVSEAMKYIDEGKSPIEVIKQIRLSHNIDLTVAKGIYVFAKEGISLNEYQDKILKELEPLLNQMENDNWEIDRIKSYLSTELNENHNPNK